MCLSSGLDGDIIFDLILVVANVIVCAYIDGSVLSVGRSEDHCMQCG